jgi:hypothetical protein
MKFYNIDNNNYFFDLNEFSEDESSDGSDDEIDLMVQKPSSKRFSKYFTKTGNKKTIEKNIDFFVVQFFENVSNSSISSDFLFNFNKNKSLANYNYLLESVLKKSKMGFSINCEKLDRKNKKRVKKTYVFRLKYITGRVRTNHFYKILSQLVLKDPCRQFYAKICNVLNSSILDFDNSGINKYKKLLLKYLDNR